MIGNNELLTAVQTSKNLKQLAKEKNVVVLLVNHVVQAAPHYIKDTSGFVRGGAKVIDNCDAYFCTSLIMNKEKSDPKMQHYVYEDNLVGLRFVNKRGKGQTVDKVLRIDDGLSIVELNDNEWIS